MRLYKRHDVDLICLYKRSGYSLQCAIKRAVLAYLDDSDERIDYPECFTPLQDLPSTAQFQLHLSPSDEGDLRIIACLERIPKGFKNSFLKNVTRYHLAKPKEYTFVDKKIKIRTERDSLQTNQEDVL